MQRRNLLIGMGSLAAGGAATIGTGAFTSTSAQRTVSVDVAGDDSAYLRLTRQGTGSNSQYAEVSNAEISINLDNSDDGGGSGLNLESETDIFDIFRIENLGTQPVFVYVDPDSITPDYVTPDGGGGYAGSQGNPKGGGMYIDPQATNRPNTGNPSLPDGISLTGIYGVNDPTIGFTSGPGSSSNTDYTPMETLLADQTTSSDKMITPSGDLFVSQPVGGQNVCAVRSLSSDSRC